MNRSLREQKKTIFGWICHTFVRRTFVRQIHPKIDYSAGEAKIIYEKD